MPQGTGRKVQLKAGGSLGAGSSKRGLVSFGFCATQKRVNARECNFQTA